MSHRVFLVRHGETEWSRLGRHTGRTEIALTEEGRRRAVALGSALRHDFAGVWTSPLGRAQQTCALAGFAHPMIVEDLREWDYGVYEGRTTEEIRRQNPQWSIWTANIEGGESLAQVAARAQRVVDHAISHRPSDIALFAHGHILRILAACWIGQPPIVGRFLALDTASISVLGYERQTRVIRQWNFVP